MAAISNHHASDLTSEDKIYMTLPLYHVAGGMLAISQTLAWGSPMIIRTSFSARNFWKDCIKYNATVWAINFNSIDIPFSVNIKLALSTDMPLKKIICW